MLWGGVTPGVAVFVNMLVEPGEIEHTDHIVYNSLIYISVISTLDMIINITIDLSHAGTN